jgi:amino acid transporter
LRGDNGPARRNSVSAIEATLIAIAGTAPANTIATSTAALIAVAGLSGPGALLFGAIPMFGIALPYYYLNAWRSDSGAAYVWVGRTISPELGFFAGWAMLVAQVLFMVSDRFRLPMRRSMWFLRSSLTTSRW